MYISPILIKFEPKRYLPVSRCNRLIGRLHPDGSKRPSLYYVGYPFPNYLVEICEKGLNIGVLSGKIGITSIKMLQSPLTQRCAIL